MEAAPGTSTTSTCREKKKKTTEKHTLQLINIKCKQNIKIKHLSEIRIKYNSTAASVPLSLLCYLTGVYSSETLNSKWGQKGQRFSKLR